MNQANTMSGTRFNTKLDDLASSITVMTKDQMSDFAMLDVNDVFLYAANTEGTGTYTDFVIDRNGSVSDNVQLNPTQANRVRGIASANVSLGNIETMGRVPVDPSIVESVEISRGPNANVFGLGQPSGTVNMVPSSARLQNNRNSVEMRVDSYGGYRASLDVNRVLLPEKLAIRGSAVFQHEDYEREPAGTDTERYNFMVKYRPFKATSISASYFYYHLYGNRPNALPPSDNISYWIASGRPTWDPVSRVVHINGTTLGPITAATFPASFGGQNTDYFTSGYLGSTDSQMFIDQNGLSYWSAPASVTGSTPAANMTSIRFLQPTAVPGARGSTAASAQTLFRTTPSVRDKSIYDWSSINLSSPNYVWDTSATTNVQLEQFFLNTPKHFIAAQFAFMREDAERFGRNILGIANDLGQSGQLTIDINERRLDGTPNPFFLRPYIATNKPRTEFRPAKWDTYRAQLAYRLDLTREEGILKWLGWHQFTGYYEYKKRVDRRYSWRDVITNDLPWIPAGVYRGNQSGPPAGVPANITPTKSLFRYYVGDASSERVEYAPTPFQFGTYDYHWGNTEAGTFNTDSATLGLGAVTDGGGGGNNSIVILKTVGAVVQSHFLDDRIVTTFGTRKDEVYTRFGLQPLRLTADGLDFDRSTFDAWETGDWRFNEGTTNNFQIVARPFARLREGASDSNAFVEFARGLSFYYNKSDSFLPATPAQDLYLNPLPNPTGEEDSYGIGMNLFDGKVVVRATYYENTQLNKRDGDAGTINQRVIRTDLPLRGTTDAFYLLHTVLGGVMTRAGQPGWLRQIHREWTTAQVDAEVARIMQIPTAHQEALIDNNPPIAATNDVEAKGTEIEININPNREWTISASLTDTRSITTNISSTLDRWINERRAVWPTIMDPTGPDHLIGTADDGDVPWFTTNYGGSQTASENFDVFVGTPYNVFKQLEGKNNPQIRRYKARISTNYRLAGITSDSIWSNVNIGGAIRWEDKGAIGYYGVQQLPDIITDLDADRPIWDKSRFYFDLFIGYRTKMWKDKVSARFQLNVRNIQEGGRLQPIAACPDGTPTTYRIVDPRQFILTASFDL